MKKGSKFLAILLTTGLLLTGCAGKTETSKIDTDKIIDTLKVPDMKFEIGEADIYSGCELMDDEEKIKGFERDLDVVITALSMQRENFTEGKEVKVPWGTFYSLSGVSLKELNAVKYNSKINEIDEEYHKYIDLSRECFRNGLYADGLDQFSNANDCINDFCNAFREAIENQKQS